MISKRIDLGSDGSLMSRFGKLIFIENLGACSFVTPMKPNSFAILYNFSTYNYIDLAQSVQNSGGSTMIYIASDYCSPGCSYSALGSGACPAECTSSCFLNCSAEYCSPGCLYSVLVAGICSKNCTEACLMRCDSICSPGCMYSDLAREECPGLCGEGSCFKSCSPRLCSPGCSYQNMAEGRCPVECTGECFSNCSSLYFSPG